jgi:chromosome partitioning protein
MMKKEWEKSYLKIEDFLLGHPLKESSKKTIKKSFESNKQKMVLPGKARELLSPYRAEMRSQVISFQMLKGGVSKTSSALNIGIRAAQYGLRVLMVDLDQQANLSFALGVASNTVPVWLDIVEKKVPLQQAIVPIFENLDLIPSNLNNSVLEKVLIKSHRNWANAIKQPLSSVTLDYDWIILDTAPSLSLVNTAVTCASHLVILPVSPDPFSIMGLRKHLQELNEMQIEFELNPFQKRILFTRFDGREKLSQVFLDQVAEEFSKELLDSYIRNSSEVKKSIDEGRTIFQMSSNVNEDYDLVTKELIHLLEEGRYAEC